MKGFQEYKGPKDMEQKELKLDKIRILLNSEGFKTLKCVNKGAFSRGI